MSISITCSGCGKTYAIDEDHAGKRGKCRKCGAVVFIPVVTLDSPFVDEPDSDWYEPPHSPHFTSKRQLYAVVGGVVLMCAIAIYGSIPHRGVPPQPGIAPPPPSPAVTTPELTSSDDDERVRSREEVELQRQQLELERQKLALEKERLEVEKMNLALQSRSSTTRQPEARKPASTNDDFSRNEYRAPDSIRTRDDSRQKESDRRQRELLNDAKALKEEMVLIDKEGAKLAADWQTLAADARSVYGQGVTVKSQVSQVSTRLAVVETALELRRAYLSGKHIIPDQVNVPYNASGVNQLGSEMLLLRSQLGELAKEARELESRFVKLDGEARVLASQVESKRLEFEAKKLELTEIASKLRTQ